MSNLISGKEALIALANGEGIGFNKCNGEPIKWVSIGDNYLHISDFFGSKFNFYLKPKTIMLNGIEVPAPFEPKCGDIYYFLYPDNPSGYGHNEFNSPELDSDYMQFGAWDSEEKIKEVVKVVKNIFKGVK